MTSMLYRMGRLVVRSSFNLIVWMANSCSANLFDKPSYLDMAFRQMWRLSLSPLHHVTVALKLDVKMPAAGAVATQRAHSTWHFENMHLERTSFWMAWFTGQVV
jgi:hypothetical protein